MTFRIKSAYWADIRTKYGLENAVLVEEIPLCGKKFTIEINSIEDLLKLADFDLGGIIIDKTYPEDPRCPYEITIYDGYVE